MIFFPLVIALTLGFAFSQTISLDLTWSHFSADGGDLIAAAAAGGVPHPTGYPLYLLLARAFQLLPAGTLAFRTNLLSALSTVLASLLLYRYLLALFPGLKIRHLVAFAAALAYGLAPFVWGQALVTEVYALHNLLMIACLSILRLDENSPPEWLRGLAFGLAAANHLSALIVFPLLLLDDNAKGLIHLRAIGKRSLGVLSGLALYALLPLRASFDPAINWGDASTPAGFLWLVSGTLYRDYWFDLPALDLIQRFRAFGGLLLDQFTWIGVLLAFYGLISRPPRRILIPTLWMAAAYLFISIFYGSRDSQVNLMPVWLAFAIWIACGLHDLSLSLQKNPRLQLLLPGLFLAVVAFRIPATFARVDLSGDVQARNFLDRTLDELPRNSIVFVEPEEQLFSLWYATYGLDQRPDLAVVAVDLWPYEWYRDSLGSNHPDLIISETGALPVFELAAANPGRRLCYITRAQPLLCR